MRHRITIFLGLLFLLLGVSPISAATDNSNGVNVSSMSALKAAVFHVLNENSAIK